MITDKEVVHFILNLTGEQRSLRGVYDREGAPCNVKTLGLLSYKTNNIIIYYKHNIHTKHNR